MVKIGLEIHGYLVTNEKLFCRCKALHGIKTTKPNINICPICTGQLGAKPLLPNKTAVDKAIQISLILGCKINNKLVWQRKHYDWPDLPKGYQNTISGPYAIPVGTKGKFLGIGITEAHLEEDPAAWNPKTGEVDYNRSGFPLIEIVTEPDFKSSEQVIDWLKQLLATLSYIKAIDKSMGIKCDVNVSTNGERVEVKNVNSLNNIKKAIEHEISRQKTEKVRIQETRRFNENRGTTSLMRTKEQAEDYRFISEPDLPIIKIENKRIESLKSNLPETPKEKLDKLIKKYKIGKTEAEILTKNLELVEITEEIIKKIPKVPQTFIASFITIELNSFLKYNKLELETANLDTKHIAELIELEWNNKITHLKSQEILRSWKEKSTSPKKQAEKHSTISDKSEIQKIAKIVIKENSKAVSDYKNGETKALNFLIGQVMRLSDKRADFKTAKEILEKELK